MEIRISPPLTFAFNKRILKMKNKIIEMKINPVYQIMKKKISILEIKIKKKITEMKISLFHENDLTT